MQNNNNYDFLYQCVGSPSKLVTRVCVYGLGDSVKASGYPMDAIIDDDALEASDWGRAKGLGTTNIGEGHDNYLSGIVVQFDLTASIKMWTEFERYHFAQIVSSQSTMHRLSKFNLDDKFMTYTDPQMIHRIMELQKRYNESKDPRDRLILLYSCPVGLKLTARVTTNYRQLKTIYYQRKNHTLPEWREFCTWMEECLPSFSMLCLKKESN